MPSVSRVKWTHCPNSGAEMPGDCVSFEKEISNLNRGGQSGGCAPSRRGFHRVVCQRESRSSKGRGRRLRNNRRARRPKQPPPGFGAIGPKSSENQRSRSARKDKERPSYVPCAGHHTYIVAGRIGREPRVSISCQRIFEEAEYTRGIVKRCQAN